MLMESRAARSLFVDLGVNPIELLEDRAIFKRMVDMSPREIGEVNPAQGAKAIRVFVADRREPAEMLEGAGTDAVTEGLSPRSIWIRDSKGDQCRSGSQ
jgi:hypothetical protein